jgi:hypothetical protein
VTAPAFIIASDLLPHQLDWNRALAQAESLVEPVARILGFRPRVRLASVAMHPGEDAGNNQFDRVLGDEADLGADEIFVLPASLDWNMWQREAFGRTLAEFRRAHASVVLLHDDVDPCHPLVVECFADAVARALAGQDIPPQRVGLLLVASGHGESGSRAQSYRLMRLVWEQLSLSRADVAFLRHAQVFLCSALERCLREPLHWVLVPQSQWWTEHVDYARTILQDFAHGHPEAEDWPLADPPGGHPSLTAWLTQRMTRLWQEKRGREATRAPSRKSVGADCAQRFWTGKAWEAAPSSRSAFIARATNREALAAVLERALPPSDTYLVKVTWHGYATGTYTDPAALDLLLGALPGRAVILEGHTTSRNLGGVDFDWETEAQNHRAWIRQQEMEYLRRTGLAEVLARHRAEYVNVTEAYWDRACAPPPGNVTLHHPELAAFIPESLLALRGAPFLSFARFKGPTRLGISNLFGLIPAPLRTAWHGASITDFASVCCDIATLYGCLFPMFGVVEALYSGVRWDRKGLYRSRWGNYDVVLSDGVVTVSEGLAGADILASRLQGQDVSRSAFFDVVREELAWPERAVSVTLPPELQTAFL